MDANPLAAADDIRLKSKVLSPSALRAAADLTPRKYS